MFGTVEACHTVPTRREPALRESACFASRNAFLALPAAGQDAAIEFLKTLQVLPPGTPGRIVVDETFQSKAWPPIPDNQL